MSAAKPLPAEAKRTTKQTVDVTLTFPDFKAAWEARGDKGKLKSEPFTVGDHCLQIQLSFTSPDKVSLYVCQVAEKSAVVPLCVTSCNVKFADSFCEFEKEKIFIPPWCDWEPREGAGLQWGWSTFATEQAFLTAAEKNEGLINVQIQMEAVLCPCADFSKCLLPPKAVAEAIWSGPCIVTLNGEKGASGVVPKQILTHFSAPLSAALHSDMTEGKSNVIDMPDVSQQALDDLRSCFLCGGFQREVCTSMSRLLDLLVLAKKYEISPLVDAAVYYTCIGLSRQQVSKVLLVADRHGLLRLLHAGFMYAVRSDDNFQAIVESEAFNDFSADLVRLVTTYACCVKGEDTVQSMPMNMQWGDVPHEFPDNSEWQKLSQQQLRRACLERFLGTAGTAAEMACRLSEPHDEVELSPAKRQKTDKDN
eukprot:TRINITY_DN52200_c0_g1_i1.p1 TRINITY_DN52200_c0_g1~~TRINITY_DN52200_c0_g1_i1.p1  ORF type:complete len:421 (-),score=71.41 TRINITY_DN52200_c0_g1_i1:357-1619(-)